MAVLMPFSELYAEGHLKKALGVGLIAFLSPGDDETRLGRQCISKAKQQLSNLNLRPKRVSQLSSC